MAGSTRALAKGSMGAFHKLLDPLLRTPAKLGTKEGKELVALAKKRFDVDSITRQGDNIVISKNGWRHTLDSQGRTIRGAVAKADGFTYRANEKRVFLKRAGEAGEQVYPMTADFPVLPGDTIRFGERYF